MNFADELSGLQSASGMGQAYTPQDMLMHTAVGAGRLGGEKLMSMLGIGGGSGPAQKSYETARDQIRTQESTAEAAHPYAFGGGNLAGALSSLPLGEAKLIQGAGMLPRMGNAALTGAGYGALFGAGSGEGAADTLWQTAKGAGLGAIGGAVAPPLMETLGGIGSAVTAPFRGMINPEVEAQRRVAGAFGRDYPGVTQPASLAANALGRDVPLVAADVGGQNVQAMARSAANSSPDARNALEAAINPRVETQKDRATDLVNWMTGGRSDALATGQDLEEIARRSNKGAYRTAYDAGDRPLWSPELERLSTSPEVTNAIKEAVTTGKSQAVAEGMGGFNPPINITADGRMTFNRGPNGVPTYPNLQFWDYARRNLSDDAKAAFRAGRDSEGARLSTLAKSMNNELDNLVPQYADARQGAARFFGADNALEAGQKFLTSPMGNAEAQQAVNRMSPAERQLFREGFASKLNDAIQATPDRSNLINRAFLNSNQARDRIELAMGPQNASRMEAFLRLEGMMQTTSRSIQGNSTTVRQLMEQGLAGGATGAGYALGTGDLNPTHLSAATIAGILLKRGGARINANVATNVGQILATKDPQVLKDLSDLAARNPRLLDSIRKFDNALPRVAVATATEPSQPAQAQ